MLLAYQQTSICVFSEGSDHVILKHCHHTSWLAIKTKLPNPTNALSIRHLYFLLPSSWRLCSVRWLPAYYWWHATLWQMLNLESGVLLCIQMEYTILCWPLTQTLFGLLCPMSGLLVGHDYPSYPIKSKTAWWQIIWHFLSA